MNATELLTRRNAALPEIVDVLRAQQDAKLDVVSSARNLRVVDGALRVAGADHQLTVDGVTTCDAVLNPTASADADLAAKLDIPLPYLRRMRAAKTDLYGTNVNAWLADKPDRRFLVRGLRDTASAEPGVLRAMLSDSYKIVDNLDILMSVLEGIRRAGAQVEITQADLTETHMYVKVRSAEVAEMAPELLAGYRSPFTGARGADNPLVFAGFVLFILSCSVDHASELRRRLLDGVVDAWSAGPDDRCRLLGRRVVSAADVGPGAAFSEGQGECLTKLAVLLLELLEPVCRALEALEQGGLGGSLPVGDRSPRGWSASPPAETFDLGSEVGLLVEPGAGDPCFAGDGVHADARAGVVHAAQCGDGAFAGCGRAAAGMGGDVAAVIGSHRRRPAGRSGLRRSCGRGCAGPGDSSR
ncbi:hypothetical protein L3X23_00995 [Pseudonocardia sp. WMMC193]|nr:hypothetical protein [Pseudonocardia sp. WMMC193]